MKGKNHIIRAENEYANIKWCENMMTVYEEGAQSSTVDLSMEE